MSWCLTGANGRLLLRRRAFPLGRERGVSSEWSGCLGAMAQRARDSVAAPLRRSSAGWMPGRKVVRWCRTQASSHNYQGVVNGTVSEVDVRSLDSDQNVVVVVDFYFTCSLLDVEVEDCRHCFCSVKLQIPSLEVFTKGCHVFAWHPFHCLPASISMKRDS